ncbi:alpha/beta hydrolase [Candidatus Omnitrophota bacterium]
MKIAILFIIVIIIFVAGIRYIERHSIFYPMKEMSFIPSDIGLAYEDIYFTTSDNKELNGWFVPGKDDGTTLIFAHGNAGNISHRLDKLRIFNELGVNVFIFDYRGYGKSEGVPSENGVYKDIEAAYYYVVNVKGIPPEEIILYGESIGGAPCIYLAGKSKVRALITEETFTSVKDMARVIYPFMPSILFSNRFNALAKIKEVTCPKLFIHSIDDEIVPFRLGEKLFNAAPEPKKFLKIHGSHNTAFLDAEKEYKEGLKSFLREVLR